MDRKLPYHPKEGKTYTLFDKSGSTDNYYHKIGELAERLIKISNGIGPAISLIQDNSRKKRRLKRIIKKNETYDPLSRILHLITPELDKYTIKTPAHLKNLRLKDYWEKALRTSREQYHLFMLEIELTNRMNKEIFLNCDQKIALLPHCLRDLKVDCIAVNTGFDHQCQACSKNCYQNSVSQLLKEQSIEPYIWKGASIKKAVKEAYKSNQTFGIMGVACIPELTFGIRKCRKMNIPVIGLPIDANRCVRWFGEFLPNTVNLKTLKSLIG